MHRNDSTEPNIAYKGYSFSNYEDKILGPTNTIGQLIFNWRHFVQRMHEIVTYIAGVIL
jgi:hypothetical protein